MKKVIFVAGVAVLALAAVTSAAFSTNLTVGSTGADVSALQTWLISSGFSIPAGATGYFGSQTKAALASYQKSVGLPAYGFFGPLTQAKLNGTAVATTPAMGCPAGYTCTANPGTTPVVGGSAGISTPGIPGTLAASLWTSPSDGTTVYKGQSYDVVAYKLQAAASDMAVQSIGLHFNSRIWLYAGAITLKDDTGAVVGQISNLTSSNFSELTVGSDYLVTIPVSGYVVKASQTRYITASLSFLAVSDRATNTGLSVTSASIRSVDGTGVTDTESVNSARTFSYQGNGAGQVVVTVDGSSPLSKLVQISTGGQTTDVPLAVYDVKVQNAPANLRSISFIVNTTGSKTPEQLFAQYKIKIGTQTFGANSITASTDAHATNTASSTVTFTNFGAINLPADQYVPVTLYATVQQDTNNTLDGVVASTTLVVTGAANGTTNNPSVEDASYSTLDVNDGIFVSNNLTFTASSATIGNETASAVAVGQNATTYNTVFSFTVTAGNNTLYISANPLTLLSTSTTGTIRSYLTTVQANPDSLAGDTANVEYVVPAGQSRQFTISGTATGSSGNSGVSKITAVKYGLSSGVADKTINYGLGGLQTTSIAIP
ncbi:MAG TPA: peptidoglycan-binding domain-containing protein [Candidatus Paceibacterota bacterium]|nr:peptidoglycan-binding domain-containing protein [Candidatus Paceibacterota bacterium]